MRPRRREYARRRFAQLRNLRRLPAREHRRDADRRRHRHPRRRPRVRQRDAVDAVRTASGKPGLQRQLAAVRQFTTSICVEQYLNSKTRPLQHLRTSLGRRGLRQLHRRGARILPPAAAGLRAAYLSTSTTPGAELRRSGQHVGWDGAKRNPSCPAAQSRLAIQTPAGAGEVHFSGAASRGCRDSASLHPDCALLDLNPLQTAAGISAPADSSPPPPPAGGWTRPRHRYCPARPGSGHGPAA